MASAILILVKKAFDVASSDIIWRSFLIYIDLGRPKDLNNIEIFTQHMGYPCF